MKIKSLIIDDSPFVQNLLQDEIESNTPEVEILDTAFSGLEAVEKIKKYQPDLIFLDVELADMTGFEMLEKLETKNIGTIFITSHNHYALKALKLNALDYLMKPIDSEELKIAVEKYKAKKKNSDRNEIVQKSLDNLEMLIHNILPKEIATEIKKNGIAKTTKKYESVTVLFADIKDFSKHAERMSPEELVRELDYCYSAFDLIMERFGVEKIKTIGDAYMAAGGVPVSNGEQSQNTLKAAFAMREFFREYSAKRKEHGKIPFEMRIGLHTGPVVAGIVGIKKFAYDIWGDTVNIASRMESAGEVGKINISESTFKILQKHNEFSFTSRGEVNIKGKGLMEMYFVETNDIKSND